MTMKKVKIGWWRAARVRDLLRALGSDQTIPSDLRADAAHWASAMTRKMHERDLQTVAWLLLDASGERRVPFTRRRTARYWASDLEGRS
jgi:uncharacterized protein (UPF0147 family)